MFREKYKEYNAEIAPSDELLERTLEKADRHTEEKTFNRRRKIAVAAACAVFTAGALTISVDAAMGGAVRRMLGFENSVVYDELNDTQTIYQNENGEYVIQSGERGSEGSWTMTADSDDEIFIINFKIGNDGFSFSRSFTDYMTEEDVTWEIYSGLCDFFHQEADIFDEAKEEILGKLQSCADSIENTYYKKGVELAIEDLKNGKYNLIAWVPVVAESDYSDPETEIVIKGCSWIKIDPDTVGLSEDGTAYIETQSVAGASRKIGVTVSRDENGLKIISMTVIE